MKMWRPIIRVRLISSGTTVNHYFLVDPGSDITLISKSVGEELGFIFEKGEHIDLISGITGGVSVVYRRLKLQIGNFKFMIPVAWAFQDEAPLLLGREVVFDRFDIEFKQAERKVVFRWQGKKGL